jgi:LDH2 family malate/lactate/ureidoglycolate dehydrogenase
MTSKLDPKTLRARYEAGIRDHENKRVRRQRGGTTVTRAVASFGNTVERPFMQRATKLAQMICIAAFFIIPNLLLIYVVL